MTLTDIHGQADTQSIALSLRKGMLQNEICTMIVFFWNSTLKSAWSITALPHLSGYLC